MTDIFTKSKRSEIMSKIRSKNTMPELMMARALRKGGLRQFDRKAKVFGHPDFVFEKEKVSVFVDGRFWHGYGYSKRKNKLQPFWRKKIANNIKRDKLVNNRLKGEGWKVLRFWDDQVKKEPENCVKSICGAIER